MAFPPLKPVRVQPYFGYRSQNRLLLSARALRGSEPSFTPRSRLRAMRTIMAQFATRELAGLRVTLTLPDTGCAADCVEHSVSTNAEGFAHFDLPLTPHRALPEHPQWELGTLSWANSLGVQSAQARILVPGRNSNLAVISDIDDTIIETGITGGWRNIARHWRRLFAQLPHERIAVSGADEFYGELAGKLAGELAGGPGHTGAAIPASRRPFFYVSSSPWNLFNYLIAFKRHKGLPVGPLFLRDWGLNRGTFSAASHGAHKRAAIESILAMYPDLQFALIGDDTQGDLPAFADIVARHPGRVAAVFLRTLARHTFTLEEQAGQRTIEQANVPLWLGDCFSVGLDFLRSQGFTPGGETEHILRAVEQSPSHQGDTP